MGVDNQSQAAGRSFVLGLISVERHPTDLDASNIETCIHLSPRGLIELGDKEM